MHILAELQPFDPVAGARVTLRVCSANDATITALNSQRWWPAIVKRPSFGIRTFKGDFDGLTGITLGQISLSMLGLMELDANVRRFVWAGAPVKLWSGASGQAWPWTQVLEALAGLQSREGQTLNLSLRANTKPFEADVLTAKYTGSGGAEGPIDLKDKWKPMLFGRCSNVEPILIDQVNNVYQVHGYGAIEAITKVYERASEFPASHGDYATYAALIAAAIPNGKFGTCIAAGMFRLGAPAFGVITADVDGDKAGGTWRRKTGEILLQIFSNSSISSGVIETASFTALDTALSALSNQGRIGVFITSQMDCLDLAARLCAPCNAQSGVSLLGKIYTTRPIIGSPTFTLDVQKRQEPRVQSSQEGTITEPFSYIELGYARSWRVHTEDEINLASTAPWLQIPANRAFTATFSGTIDPSSQLPATFTFRRYRGDVDVSATTAWTIESQTGITGGTVTVSDGIATIPSGCSIASNAQIRVKSDRDGVPIEGTVSITRSDAPAPSGGGGGTTVNDSSFATISSTTKVNISDEMTVKTGSSGAITFSGVLSIVAAAAANDGTFGAVLRWQYKPVGGSYSNVGGADTNETTSASVELEGGLYFSIDGEIDAAASITGLSANTDYVVKLQAARDDATISKTLSFGGTVYAVGS